MRAILFIAVLCSGCAAHQAFNSLDPESRDDLQVCHNAIAQAQCGQTMAQAMSGSDYAVGGSSNVMCMNPLIEKYAATEKGLRKRWLVRHGCPPAMVGADTPSPPSAPSHSEHPDD